MSDVSTKALWSCIALVGLLMFVWPIAHTTSLRYLLLVSVISALTYFHITSKQEKPQLLDLKTPALLFGVFILWTVATTLINGADVAWSLREIRSQWIWAFVAVVAGGLVAHVAARHRRMETLAAGIVLPLGLHALAVTVLGFISRLGGATANERIAGLTERPDTSNYLTNMLIALLLAELFVRARKGRRMLPFGNSVWIGLTIMAALSLWFEGMRNGVAVVVILVMTVCVLLLIDLKRSGSGHWLRIIVAGAALMLVSVIVVAVAGTKPGASWQRVVATIPAALDTAGNRAWLAPDPDKPVLVDGKPVDFSAYVRIAWLKEGLAIVSEHPFGVGYGRDVFGHAISAKYGVSFRHHSHSGVIDLAVGVGVPGVLLWIGFLCSLFAVGWRHFWEARNGYALALMLLVIDFGVRSFVDSNTRDHILQQFMFMVALFAALAIKASAAKERA